MARYRKLIIVSPIVLAAIVLAFYRHQLVDRNPEQSLPAQAVSDLQRADGNQAGSQTITPDNGNLAVQSRVVDLPITEHSQEIRTTSENITVSGWVGTEFGENIAGETVILYSASLQARYSSITGSSGEFIFTDLKPTWDYTLKVSPKGMFKRYTRFPIKLRFEHEVHNIVLEAIPLGLLTGRIVDPYDRPVTGIELLIKTGEIDSWSTNVTTDANGVFSVAGFPKGKFQLATVERQLLRATGLKFDPDAGEPFGLTIDLGLYNLWGRIYYESGHTFEGASVFLNWSLRENGIRIRSTRQASADASGEFQFTGLGPGEHELVVSAWRIDTFGQIIKQTVRQTVNVGVDPRELNIFFNVL